MKKLEDIPKKEIFQVPDGYFEKLPSEIQNRVVHERQNTFSLTTTGLKFALPAVVIIVAGLFWFYPQRLNTQNSESILATVSTDELVAYLNDSDLSTEDLIESADFDRDDLDAIEGSVYELNFDNESLEHFMNEID